jgi:hypothetical protein
MMSILLFVSLVSAALIAKDVSPAPSTHREGRVGHSTNKIRELFTNTKEVCVGRYLIEVPKNSIVVYGPASVPYPIKRYPDQADSFKQIVEGLVKDSIARKSKFPIGPASSPGSVVGTVLDGFSERNKVVFGVEELTGAYYAIHSVILVGKDVYVQEHSYYGDPAEMGKIVEEMKTIAANIVPRAMDGPPPSAGICIDGALVLGEMPLHHERTTVGIRLAEHNDVHLSVDMTLKDRLVDSDSLEVQLKSGEENAKAEGRGEWYSRIKFIRRSKRQVAGWDGYEVLARRPPQGKFNSTHEFSFVSQGEPRNPHLPVINLDLYTGMRDNAAGVGIPSLSDDETVELWDRLTKSIRPFATAPR